MNRQAALNKTLTAAEAAPPETIAPPEDVASNDQAEDLVLVQRAQLALRPEGS